MKRLTPVQTSTSPYSTEYPGTRPSRNPVASDRGDPRRRASRHVTTRVYVTDPPPSWNRKGTNWRAARRGRSRRDTQKARVVGQRSQIISSQHGSTTSSRVRWTRRCTTEPTTGEERRGDERRRVGTGDSEWKRGERGASFRDIYRHALVSTEDIPGIRDEQIKIVPGFVEIPWGLLPLHVLSRVRFIAWVQVDLNIVGGWRARVGTLRGRFYYLLAMQFVPIPGELREQLLLIDSLSLTWFLRLAESGRCVSVQTSPRCSLRPFFFPQSFS